MQIRRLAIPPTSGAFAWNPKAWSTEYDLILRDEGDPKFEEVGDFAVVDIGGPLYQNSNWLVDGYDAIKDRTGAALGSSRPKCLLRINSPGGDYNGMLDTSRELRAMARAAGKQLYVFSDSQIASAALALGTAADFIFASESSLVGSIGVWVPVESRVEANLKYGIRTIIVASGARKVDRNPDVPITDAAVQATQEKVDDMADLFFELVAEHRNMKASKIAALDGDEFLGFRAKALGLIDDVTTFEKLTGSSWSPAIENQKAKGKAMATIPTGGLTPQAKAKADDKDKEGKEKEGPSFEEALACLHSTAEGDDEERASQAKRMLAAMYPPEEKPKEGESKAEEKPAEKPVEKKDEKPENASAKSGAVKLPQAQATANEIELARQLSEANAAIAAINAKAAADALATERDALFAQRPDWSEAQKKTLAAAPIETLREAVKTWPRMAAAPGAAANALSPPLRPDAKPRAAGVNLSAEQNQMLAVVQAAASRPTGPQSASRLSDGGVELGIYDQAAAAKRRDELAAEKKAMGL